MNNKEIKEAILQKIESYDRIIITRHVRPDGDAIGSTKGLQAILKLSYPEKEILLLNEDYSDYLAFLGGEDTPISDDLYKDALVIVCDTGNMERISNKKIHLAKELIKIDHHIDREPYGDLSWVEDYRSSACEMIADFYITFRDKLKIDKEAASYIYTGMITDSGRFRYESVSGETLRVASVLLDTGIDTETLFAHLYLKDVEDFKLQAYVLKNIKITENGVAYIHLTMNAQQKFGLTSEQASACISYLDSIKGSLAWLAFIDLPDKKIRVRLRSRFMPINTLAEQYRGGGHAYASGATLLKRSEIKELLQKADDMVKEYKANNTGWL